MACLTAVTYCDVDAGLQLLTHQNTLWATPHAPASCMTKAVSACAATDDNQSFGRPLVTLTCIPQGQSKLILVKPALSPTLAATDGTTALLHHLQTLLDPRGESFSSCGYTPSACLCVAFKSCALFAHCDAFGSSTLDLNTRFGSVC